ATCAAWHGRRTGAPPAAAAAAAARRYRHEIAVQAYVGRTAAIASASRAGIRAARIDGEGSPATDADSQHISRQQSQPAADSCTQPANATGIAWPPARRATLAIAALCAVEIDSGRVEPGRDGC